MNKVKQCYGIHRVNSTCKLFLSMYTFNYIDNAFICIYHNGVILQHGNGRKKIVVLSS